MQIWPTKRFWKRLAIGVGLFLALALIANGLMAWGVERQLQARFAAIRADGDPVTIAELAPPSIPDEQNAAVILKQITPRIEEFANEHGRFLNKTPLGKDFFERLDRGELPTREQIEAIRAILDKYPDIDQALAKAAACERYGSQLDYSLAPQEFLEAVLELQSPIRQAARFLDWKIQVQLADGQANQAAQTGLEILRLARHYDSEPCLVSFLMACAVRNHGSQGIYDALAAGPVSPETHAAVDAELAFHDNPQRLVKALKSDRALGTGLFDLHTEPLEAFRFFNQALGWPLRQYQVGALDAWDDELRIVQQPWHEIHDQFGPPDSRRPIPPSGHGVMADLLIPVLRAACHANARTIAMLRSLRIFNALTQYQQEHTREAGGLDDLNLPHDATIDPYTGQQLKLKRTDDGWIIYSVMANGHDDGGDFKAQRDWGVAPANRRNAGL
jgi:hypothetical protein